MRREPQLNAFRRLTVATPHSGGATFVSVDPAMCCSVLSGPEELDHTIDRACIMDMPEVALRPGTGKTGF